jgi:hypothetical protein
MVGVAFNVGNIAIIWLLAARRRSTPTIAG